MKIATVSHSHIALRQQLFFREAAKQGHSVLMVSPGHWFNLRTTQQEIKYPDGNWELKTCKHMGDNIYTYKLLGAKDLVEKFGPDWLYIQAEPGSLLVKEALTWNIGRRALFVWENISIKGDGPTQLQDYDLVVCGNPEAEALIKSWNPNTTLLLQVGVDTNHFQARPNVDRNISVAYIGRAAPEKGLPYLIQAWPTVHVLEYKDFKELPWRYSQVKVIVAYSQDVPWWKEQAPSYVVLEALSCGCKVVTSDTAAMKYWLEGCPGVEIITGHQQPNDTLRTERVIALKAGIQHALGSEIRSESRDWVIERFSNPVMAKKLLEVLSEQL